MTDQDTFFVHLADLSVPIRSSFLRSHSDSSGVPMAKLDKQSMAPCFLRKHSNAGIANKEVSVSDLSLREKPQKDV